MSTQRGWFQAMYSAGVSILVTLTACDGTTEPPSGPAVAVVVDAAGRAAPENVTSARVVFIGGSGDSVRVQYGTTDQPTHSTPYRVASSGHDTIIVLGIQPSTTYQFQLESRRNGLTQVSTVCTFKT